MSGGLLSLKWNNHQSTFLHVLSSLCLNDTLSDVTLACEGEFYAAHKLVLATCSEYFEKIFEKIEGKHSVVVLKDVKSEELEALLSYMYEGEVNVLQEKLNGLIKAAEYLKIKGLSDSDENPEIFSKPFTKKKNKNSSKDGSLSPPMKRRRQTTDNCDSPPNIDSVNENSVTTDQNDLESNNHCEEPALSPKQAEEVLRNNQDFDVDIIKEEVDMELKKDVFGFQDESSHFLNEQEDNLPHVSDLALPSMSSQPGSEKDLATAFISEDGSSTSSNMWESRGEISTLNNSNRIGSSCYVTEVDQTKRTRTRTRSSDVGEHMTITPDELGPLISEEEEDGLNGTFACPFCPFKTFQKNVHETHLRRHSSEKTFFCQFCSYSCLTKSNLKCHIRKHTGEKPFACPHCNYRSAQSSNIKIHIKRMHKNAPVQSPSKEAYM